MATTDPLVSSWFGIDFGDGVVGAFTECSGLSFENDVVEYKASGPSGEYVLKKIPGRPTYGNITLKRGVTDQMDMWEWRKLVDDGLIDDARKNGSVKMFNQKGDIIARWDFVNAWPSKVTGPSANAGSNEIAIEELEITHEGFMRVSP